ncbi:MAG: carbohydrate kinase [Rhodobacteraceae bacterium]|nr:carbohydrate kinase [Paracoccaceae bacterium]
MTTRPICVLGNLNADLVMGPLSDWPAPGTEAFLDRCDFRAGGSAGNTALVLHRLGAKAGLVSSTGDDDLAVMLAEPFYGPLDRIVRLTGRTGISVGLAHPDGDRSFLSFTGHLDHTDLALMRGQLADWPLDGALALVSGGFAMPGLRPGLRALLDHLRLEGAETAIDPGWPGDGWTRATRAEVLGWAKAARHLLLNDKEVTGLADIPDPLRAATALRDALPHDTIVVVKRGAQGALAAGPDGIETAPARDCAPFDTVGAGDAFNAGYLAALASGADLRDALAAGTRTAGSVISAFPRDTGPLPGWRPNATQHPASDRR